MNGEQFLNWCMTHYGEVITLVILFCVGIGYLFYKLATKPTHEQNTNFTNKGSQSAPIVQGNGTVENIVMGNTIEVKTLQVIHTQGESKEKPDAEPDAHVTPPCMPRSLGKIRLRGARRPRKNGIM